MKRKIWKIGTVTMGLLVTGGAVVMGMLTTQQPGCGCGDSGKAYMGTFVRAQEYLFTETGAFSEDPAVLAKEMGAGAFTSKRYRFKFEAVDDLAYASATPYEGGFQAQVGPIKGPKKPYFKSKVSAIAVIQGEETAPAFPQIVCESLEPMETPLQYPDFDGQRFSCPANAREIY